MRQKGKNMYTKKLKQEILKAAKKEGVQKTVKKYKVSAASIYVWRRKK